VAEAGLAELQRWMHNSILAGGVRPEIAAERIGGTGALTPTERLAIYSDGYRARLLDSLGGEYPALKSLVGETVFGLFAGAYVAARPPNHFSLYELGAGFADYLEATRPRDPDSALPAQLARLERARAEAQRAEGIERRADPALGAAALAPGFRLALPDSVWLLRLDFDFIPLIEATGRGEPALVPEAREALIAVSRSDYRVRVRGLQPWQYAWLEALGREGADVHVAAATAAAAGGRAVGATLADLILWLPGAAQMGLVTRG
jgi:hypothetical protein